MRSPTAAAPGADPAVTTDELAPPAGRRVGPIASCDESRRWREEWEGDGGGGEKHSGLGGDERLQEERVGKQILQRTVEAYRKIRNTGRYLLANLYDFDPSRTRCR